MASRITNKDIVEILETVVKQVKESSPNGNLDKIKDKIDCLTDSQEKHAVQMDTRLNEVNTSIRKLEKRLYNPDNGIIVNLKDTTRIANEANTKVEELENVKDDVDSLKEWKSTMIKMLIVLIPTALSAIGWVVAQTLGGK